jgi:hypothetical protein
VAGLLLQQAQGGGIAEVRPVDTTALEVIAKRLDGTQEFALFHGEGADGKRDGCAFLQEQQGFQHGGGIFAAGERYGDAVAIANHLETGYGFPHLAQQDFFQFHCFRL